MKLDFGETREEKDARLQEWHRWFAWYPVYVGPHDYRWMEYVERRLILKVPLQCYKYRALNQ
jgi:hypothetical protein